MVEMTWKPGQGNAIQKQKANTPEPNLNMGVNGNTNVPKDNGLRSVLQQDTTIHELQTGLGSTTAVPNTPDGVDQMLNGMATLKKSGLP